MKQQAKKLGATKAYSEASIWHHERHLVCHKGGLTKDIKRLANREIRHKAKQFIAAEISG